MSVIDKPSVASQIISSSRDSEPAAGSARGLALGIHATRAVRPTLASKNSEKNHTSNIFSKRNRRPALRDEGILEISGRRAKYQNELALILDQVTIPKAQFLAPSSEAANRTAKRELDFQA